MFLVFTSHCTLIVLLGKSLLTKRKTAINECKKHTDEFNTFTATLAVEDVKSWENMIRAWEQDQSAPDPYVVTTKSKL
jgi:hypothetical protein